ncbi:hypothetical protein JTE90_024004 [Oedothorax gibbosus]|uniref:EGF-like domain-containing protein n=1 Tax=Oedothorax gibbosus TaxID=931172 RepID=A0AAV6VAK4_9ARAC|nr:hypothetical protein JTE90_024004 [Oedothorax gibbosus]
MKNAQVGEELAHFPEAKLIAHVKLISNLILTVDNVEALVTRILKNVKMEQNAKIKAARLSVLVSQEGKAFCECADNKQFDTHKGQCGKTCEDDDKCPSNFRCKPVGGYNFCVCANDFTGYECELIIDCEPSGKYANCTKAGGLCWHNGTKSICDCKGKEYDTQSGTCRATCDPNKSECVNEANCEVQDGKHFCTCVEGLTGDFCNIINECQPSGKYGKCESSGGNCTFSEGNAGCSCGTGKLFDSTEGQCKDACGTVICRNGAQCKDGKCECPTGLSGTDCLTVEGCTEDLEKICKAISSKCIYDSKKEKKASCECTKNNQKFDGETCKDCDCWKNQECFFDEKKEKQCLCIDKFSDNNGNCEQCDCGQNGKCSFVNGEKKCACNDRYKEDEGTCKICDCGKNGDCIFEDHNQTCVCNDGFAELEGKCEECDCGDYGECSFVNETKNCNCKDDYLDKNGTCTGNSCYQF